MAAARQQTAPSPRSLDHIEQFRLLYGERWRLFPAVIIIIYLLGTSISKFIITGKTLSRVFAHVQYLGTVEFWLGLFFVSGAAFSFQSIEKTRVLQSVIAFVRLTTIFLMIGGSIYLIVTQGRADPLPSDGVAFNTYYFAEIFSNSIFSLMCHHTLPSLIGTVKNSQQVRYFVSRAFFAAGSIQILLPLLGCFAFGAALVEEGGLKYYSNDFEDAIPFIYYVSSFYVFLNIAAVSVYVIVIRSSLLKIVAEGTDPNKVGGVTVAVSGALLVIMLLVSYFLQNQIEVLFEFIAGIFGSAILLILPSLEVWRARALVLPSKNKSILPCLIILMALAFMAFNLMETIQKLLRK